MLHNSCNRVLERAYDGSAVIVEVHIPLSLKRIWPSVCDKLQLCENACIRESDPENLRLTSVDLYSMCCIESSVSMSLCYSHDISECCTISSPSNSSAETQLLLDKIFVIRKYS